VLITLIAAGALVASALVMHFYRLDARAHAQLVQEIARARPAWEQV
jgi:Na+/melibiose symporter-like transporter